MLQYELRLSQIESAERAKIQELRERLEFESQERMQKARPLHISSAELRSLAAVAGGGLLVFWTLFGFASVSLGSGEPGESGPASVAAAFRFATAAAAAAAGASIIASEDVWTGAMYVLPPRLDGCAGLDGWVRQATTPSPEVTNDAGKKRKAASSQQGSQNNHAK